MTCQGIKFLGWTLHSNTVVRLAPPLVITKVGMNRGLNVMRAALLQACEQHVLSVAVLHKPYLLTLLGTAPDLLRGLGLTRLRLDCLI